MCPFHDVGVGEHLVDRALDDAVIHHDECLVGPSQGQVDVMGCHGHRRAGLVQPSQRRHHPRHTVGVQPGGRFVEHEQFGSHGHGSGHRDTFAFPVGQLVGGAFGQVIGAQQGEGPGDPFAHLVLVESHVHRAERDVLEDVCTEELVVGILQDVLDDATMLPQRLLVVLQTFALTQHLTGHRFEGAGQAAQQGRLARAVGAKDCDAHPLMQPQVDVPQHHGTPGMGGTHGPGLHQDGRGTLGILGDISTVGRASVVPASIVGVMNLTGPSTVRR